MVDQTIFVNWLDILRFFSTVRAWSPQSFLVREEGDSTNGKREVFLVSSMYNIQTRILKLTLFKEIALLR